MNSYINVDDIAAPQADAWKPAIGETVKGTITYVWAGERTSYDGSKTEKQLRIVLDTGDAEVTIYATMNTNVNGDGYAKRDAKAIAAAVRASGASTLEVGGTLAVKRVDNVPTDKGEANVYVAEYQPPAASQAPTADQADGAVSGLI